MAEPERDDPQARENAEPAEGNRCIPWIMLALIAALSAWGTAYLVTRPFDPMTPSDAAAASAEATAATTQAPEQAPAAAAVAGRAVYAAACAACHQAGGAGLPGVFPPLAGSEWVSGRAERLIALVMAGFNGPMRVAGVDYNGTMPGFAAQLDDAELAAVLSHLRADFNAAEAISPAQVAAVRAQLPARAFASEQALNAFGQ